MIPVTTLYLAACVVIFSILSFSVIRGRRAKKILVGNGEDQDFLFTVRGHGNFAEYAPIALLCMAAAELSGAAPAAVHGSGILLLAGRTLHAYYFLTSGRILKIRVAGMVLTFSATWSATAAAVQASLPAVF